jgi:hypothetical protein
MEAGAVYVAERYLCHACEARSIAAEDDGGADAPPAHGVHYGVSKLRR